MVKVAILNSVKLKIQMGLSFLENYKLLESLKEIELTFYNSPFARGVSDSRMQL